MSLDPELSNGESGASARLSLPTLIWQYAVVITFLCCSAFTATTLAWFHPEIPVPSPIHFAVVMPMTGSEAAVGRMMVNAVQLQLDSINELGGVNGRRFVLDVFDDRGDPEVAQNRAREIAAGPTLAVIGHYSSVTSTAAAPIYKAARLPALTGSSNADSLTFDNPYYFRLTFDSSAQGAAFATYVQRVFKKTRASVLYTDEEFGRSLNAAFRRDFEAGQGIVPFQWRWDPHATAEQHAALIDQVAQDIGHGDSGPVILAMSPYTEAKQVLTLLRRRGVDPVMIGASALETNFPEFFAGEPEERAEPGFFTKNLYAAATILYDSADDRGVAFQDRFVQRYGEQPSARAANYFETAVLLTTAVQKAGLQIAPASRDNDRQKIRDWIATQTDAGTAVKEVTGPIYFGPDQTTPKPVRMGRAINQHFVSAPLQLAVVSNPALIELDKERAAGNVVRIGDKFY